MIRVAASQLWGASVARETDGIHPDCSLCRKPEYKRARTEWGCDTEAEDPVFRIHCPACEGLMDVCRRCDGTGFIYYKRCPSAVLTESFAREVPTMQALLDLWQGYEKHGVLPEPGGLLNQCGMAIEAISEIEREKGRWSEIVESYRKSKEESREQKGIKGRR